jgi:hypothetical protein
MPRLDERHGLAAEVLKIDPRRKNPVRELFEEMFPYPTYFAERRRDANVKQTPRLVDTELLIECIRKFHSKALLQHPHIIYHHGRVRTDTSRSYMCWKTDGKYRAGHETAFGTYARALVGHLGLGLLSSLALEGGRKTRLGGELRREEQRLSRSRGAWIESGPSTT